MLAIGRRPAALGQRTSALSTPVAVLMPPPLSVERDLAVVAGSCNGGVDQQLGEVENLAAMHTLTALLLTPNRPAASPRSSPGSPAP
jgi:hypothetical protein